jgi:hypothetical protein
MRRHDAQALALVHDRRRRFRLRGALIVMPGAHAWATKATRSSPTLGALPHARLTSEFIAQT